MNYYSKVKKLVNISFYLILIFVFTTALANTANAQAVPGPTDYGCTWDPGIPLCIPNLSNGCLDPSCDYPTTPSCYLNSTEDFCINTTFFCDCGGGGGGGTGPIDFNLIQQVASPRFPLGSTIGDVIRVSLTYIFSGAGLVLVIFLLYGGFTLMLSRGDPNGIAKGRSIITLALMGFVVVFTSYWIIQFIGEFLDIQAIKDIF